MSNSTQLDEERLRIFEETLCAMAKFKRTFGRGVDSSVVAELYVAKELGLQICTGINEPGYDALGPDGERYQIKFRNAQNVDVNNFDFDYLVLVNLDDDYRLIGAWRITVAQAHEIFTWRAKFRKHQATQAQVKSVAERIL